MLGRVVLYEYHINSLKRPDSKRPQALKSRVDTREAEWKPHCGREAERKRHSGRPAIPAYTERPARVQFMLGRVALYEYHINSLKRPDSKRPAAALKSRVVCAKRRGSRTAAAP